MGIYPISLASTRDPLCPPLHPEMALPVSKRLLGRKTKGVSGLLEIKAELRIPTRLGPLGLLGEQRHGSIWGAGFGLPHVHHDRAACEEKPPAHLAVPDPKLPQTCLNRNRPVSQPAQPLLVSLHPPSAPGGAPQDALAVEASTQPRACVVGCVWHQESFLRFLGSPPGAVGIREGLGDL